MKRLEKNFSPMKSLAWFAALAATCLTLTSCTSTSSVPPSSPSSGGGSSYTLSYNSPEIEASIAMQMGTTQPAQVILMTTGSLVNNAAITLTGPSSLSLPLTFNYSASSGTTYITYYTSGPWTYQANQNYTMSVNYSGYSGQATVHSVGNVSFTPGGSSLGISWLGGGNHNSLIELQTVSPNNQYSITSGVNSPYTVNQSSLGSYTAGSYDIELTAVQMNISCFSGAYVGCFFSATDQESTTY